MAFKKSNKLQNNEYKLIVSLENEDKEIIAPSENIIIKYIDKLPLFLENFLILECNNRLNDFTFIQTVAEFKEDGKTFTNFYWAEAQREEIADNKKVLRQYGCEATRKELITIFTSYLLGITPEVSQWELVCEIDPNELD